MGPCASQRASPPVGARCQSTDRASRCNRCSWRVIGLSIDRGHQPTCCGSSREGDFGGAPASCLGDRPRTTITRRHHATGGPPRRPVGSGCPASMANSHAWAACDDARTPRWRSLAGITSGQVSQRPRQRARRLGVGQQRQLGYIAALSDHCAARKVVPAIVTVLRRISAAALRGPPCERGRWYHEGVSLAPALLATDRQDPRTA